MQTPIDVFAGLAGTPLSVDTFDLGGGIIAERMFAHLMAPFMLAFTPATHGKPHPAPWRAAHGGLGFDMVVQLSNPASLENESPLGQQATLAWVVALLRLRVGPNVWFLWFQIFLLLTAQLAKTKLNIGHTKLSHAFFGFAAIGRGKSPKLTLDGSVSIGIPRLALPLNNLRSKYSLKLSTNVHSPKETSLAVLWLWSALEAMFSTGREELRYRMSTIIAAYLEPAGLSRMSLQKSIAKLYDGRSAAAHGREDKAHDSLGDTFDLVRRIVVRIIETNEVPTRAGLEARLFGADPS